LGCVKISEINISDRFWIDTYDGKRIQRYDGDQNNEHLGYFACDGRLYLSYDDFGYWWTQLNTNT
jgi:hypothetical protein